MQPKNVIRVLLLFGLVFVFGSSLATWKFPEHGDYVDVMMAIYIVLSTVFGLAMLKRSKTP